MSEAGLPGESTQLDDGHPVWEAVSDLARLGFGFEEILLQSGVNRECLVMAFEKLKLHIAPRTLKRAREPSPIPSPVPSPVSLRASSLDPVRPVQTNLKRGPAKFADISWMNALIIELSSDDELEDEPEYKFTSELEAKESQIRMMKQKIAELESSLRGTNSPGDDIEEVSHIAEAAALQAVQLSLTETVLRRDI
ncbi:unnamed protein product [Kuraishia capsulata CBS 1993]|uniref:Uncharacterized protein n=1 Tax=Kuraishia capsulata CBS 1993 TaxID=1382522 RepID=W6MHB1_9ASCO|nr:uncharacterized protein KUCA_T00001320001 [Kuraishia capsulata CBS 1993]CDK25351.1 unnamed protein product [Kuraishia capsulata CBS 1993]